MSERVVIIGGGMAGRRLEQLLPSYDVTVLGNEVSYHRHRLTEYVAGRAPAPVLGTEPVTTVVAVDRGRRVVTDSAGSEWSYDHLVFAIGGEPVVPVAGRVLRTAEDARLLAGTAARRVVVLGGGVLGVETACALRGRGVAVTLVHDGETLLNKQMPRAAGRWVTRALRQLGIEVLLNAQAVAAQGTVLTLANGQQIFGELVATCGVRPRVELAAGLTVRSGIVVDQTMTSPDDSRVHAIGDCAEVDGRVSGTVASAWAHAEALASWLESGTRTELAPEVIRLTAGALDVLVLGDQEAEGEEVRLEDGDRWVRAVLKDGVVRAAVAVGAPEVAAELVLLADRGTPVVADGLLADPVVPQQKAVTVCRCNGVTRAALEAAWRGGADSVAGIAATTRATTGCGSCTGAVGELLDRFRRGETEPVPARRATMTELSKARHVVVVGGGMVAHRLVEALRARDTGVEWRITVLAEEPRLPYDRVALTSYFSGRDPHDLALGDPELWNDPAVVLRKGTQVTAIDVDGRTVTTARGEQIAYDELVLATGSSAFVPPVKNSDAQGCFVCRTIDDVAALRTYVERLRGEREQVTGVVVGGGLLGLEAAGALRALGAATTVVEFAPRLMPLQVDEGGGAALARLIRGLDVDVRTSTQTTRVKLTSQGAARAMAVADGPDLPADVVVFATGVRPRDELARAAGLTIGERGGVVVDEACRTSAPGVWAIGEVACIDGRVWGLVAPGNTMAEIVADRLLGGAATFPGADTSTKLKLLGVDVASFGDAFGATEGALDIVYADPVAGVYKKLVLSDDARTLLGGILVGDASAYSGLRPMVGRELGADPAGFLLPEGAAPVQLELPDDAPVCSCNNVAAGAIRCAVRDEGCGDVKSVCGRTKAGTSCGSCLPIVKTLVNAELLKAGVEVSKALCEHFSQSRAELFDVVRVTGLRTFSEIIERHGTGRGCDICKPVVGSILASIDPAGHVLDRERAPLQDTNDHVMANMQKDGTYSVVPRIPGGEITPEGLITIGEVARDFGLYTKITGGQRVDLFGARIEQLPAIWKRLVDAGFESGHAYGKALRTVKSCVGSTWCRYGVQDSVGMAIALELRYRGLRSPHKLKLGVSGCARECAEARGKDVGIIATENGWNLYVGGNGGMTPRHAELLASDLSDAELTQAIDRFLMYYVRTGDRLQRTSVWIREIEGGLDHVRDVVLNDSLGIAADLDAAMAEHVGAYVDEWRATLEDPEKLARFVSFVNAPDQPDEDLRYVVERNQPRPATPAERGQLEPVLLAGPRLEVRR
ncbi:nitrite reductase large subunit [Kribbella sandramycini]|uniref:assimilatory sulfite reductase (ferredoxin) n=1 Tax=Kribbella sandramycini TaxID=60450 RepID=A0A7Y4L7S3_9ACTN|nr:nitrite reductase large subunit NirB [Kribbella sandramycini]MBB6567009.1 nitrite reductase (NADH) large subunit [Kribbella sandramycini]NOL44731.1 nitrite reductase large subunit [Kribbella sandramycini]